MSATVETRIIRNVWASEVYRGVLIFGYWYEGGYFETHQDISELFLIEQDVESWTANLPVHKMKRKMISGWLKANGGALAVIKKYKLE